MRSWVRPLAIGVLLAAAIPLRAVLAAESAEQVLLDKANYWRLKDRPDLAMEALTKLLFLDPNQVEGLYQLGMLEVQQGKIPDARLDLARLQKADPTSPHIVELENAIRAGKIGPNELNQARRLAQSGQLTEAIEKYQEAFRGPPPPSFGIEYYLTLSGTPGGWDQALQGLQQLAQSEPNNKEVKLALAQVMINRQDTRPDGITALIQLSKDPVVGADAVKLWRQALLWGAPTPLYAQYLAQFPQDQEVRQRAADIAAQSGGAGASAQSQAYVDLQHGKLAAAEKQFAASLHSNPNDAQALGGLGLVRLRQQRFAQARDLLGRAMRADPADRKNWTAAYDSASFWASVEEAKALQSAGKLQQARALLNRLLAHPRGDSWGAEMVLANVESRLHDNTAAEQTYRRVLKARPGNGDALVGLASVLTAQGKTAEAKTIIDRLTPAERARLTKNSVAPAELLRQQAKNAEANGNYALAEQKFKQAIADDARAPWIRLDYARFLAGQGRINEGFAVVDPMASGNTPDSVLVAAMYDVQQDRWAAALDKVDSVPVNERSSDLKNFRDRILSRATEDRAEQLIAAGNRTQARNILVALYTNPDVLPDERRIAAYDLYRLGYQNTALQLTRREMERGGAVGVKAGIDYAKLLVTDARYSDAEAVVARLEASPDLTADDRDELLSAKAILVSRNVDKLLVGRHFAEAYDLVSPLLVARPNDPIVLMTVGRIFAAAGRDTQALKYFDQAYQQDPDDVGIIRGVVMGSIQADDIGQAQKYLDAGEKAHPKNPWMFYLQAQIERARGNNRAAMSALRTAESLAKAQGLVTPSSAQPETPALKLPPNPFRSDNTVPPALRSAGV